MENKQEQKAKELAAKRAKYPVLDGGVTDEMRQSWKQANGRVIAVDVFDDMAKEHHVAYFRRPTMDVMSAVNAVSKQDELKGADTMFKNCWLGDSQNVSPRCAGQSVRHLPHGNKKLVGAHTLSDIEDEQTITKGCALIRANFHIDPGTLTYDEWAGLYEQAVWLERTRLLALGKLLEKLFAEEPKK